MKKKILTISILVSGREETTEKNLQSLQPLREQLGAELILTDTGCSPEYLEKIKGYADRILSFTWCRDFAKARNLGLEAANSEWFMYVDDDEWFEDVTDIIRFFTSGEYKEYHQAVYIQRNYHNFEGTSYGDDWASRMIRIEEDTHFEGRVHEALVPTRGKCKRLNAYVHHYGYVFATEEERVLHFQRNTSILEELIEEEPNNLRWPLQLLQEYGCIHDTKSLRRTAEKGLKQITTIDKAFMNMCRGSFYLALLMADAEEGLYEALWTDYKQFLDDARNPWNVRCALSVYVYYQLSAYYKEVVDRCQSEVREDGYTSTILSNSVKGDEVEFGAGEQFDGFKNKKERLKACAQEYFYSLLKYNQEERTEQEQIIAESVVLIQDYMTDRVVLDMCYKCGEYAGENISLLIEDIQNRIAGNGEFLSLPEHVWEMAQHGVLPLEEMLLTLPISQWMVQMTVLEQKGYNDRWGKIGEQLASICTQGDIRYSYFDMITENTKMQTIYASKANIEKMDYETMTGILSDFAQANVNYMDYMYTEQAFDGDMEILSEIEKAAVWIANGLSIDLSEWRDKIQCFGNAAKVWPKLGEFMKKYIKFVGEAAMAQLG